MSNRDFAKDLIDQIPEGKLIYIIPYLQGAAIPDETPNAETLEAFKELESGGGHKFTGSTENLFAELMEDWLCLMYGIPPSLKKISRPVQSVTIKCHYCSRLLIRSGYPHHFRRKTKTTAWSVIMQGIGNVTLNQTGCWFTRKSTMNCCYSAPAPMPICSGCNYLSVDEILEADGHIMKPAAASDE